MRALLSRNVGGPETLELGELPEPVAGPGQVVVAVRACGINHPDLLILEDRYQFKPPRPFAPGGEIAGVIETIGEDVAGWAPGDRVVALVLYGGLADRIVVNVADLHPLPADRSFAEGATLLFTYGTAMHALADRGEIAAGRRVLVLGAAGGVGIAATQVAKAFGAFVAAAVSSPAKAAVAREAGADTCVIYDPGPLGRDESRALGDRLKAAAPAKAYDIVVDCVGGDYAEPALRSMAWEGRYLVIGFPAGIPRPPLNIVLLKSCDVRGVFWGAFMQRFPDRAGAHVRSLFQLWREGRIAPRLVQQAGLEQAGGAIARAASRASTGKTVILLDQD